MTVSILHDKITREGDQSMEKKRVKTTDNLERYAGKWVALSRNRIVAAGSSLSDVMHKLPRRTARVSPALFLVPRRDEGPYVLLLIS